MKEEKSKNSSQKGYSIVPVLILILVAVVFMGGAILYQYWQFKSIAGF